MAKLTISLVALAMTLFGAPICLAKGWKAGVAKVDITPRRSLWMAGYAARTRPSEGTLHPLYAKALALQDESGKRAVLVTSDLLGFPASIADRIAERARKQYGLPRDRLILNSSHTHCGPVVDRTLAVAYDLTAEQWSDIDAYTRELEDKVVAAIGAAVRDLHPAGLAFGRTEAGFAENRRLKLNPNGPVDHDVPILRVQDGRGRLRAVLFGYACHNTTLGGDFCQFNGDYAGFAQQQLERQYPGAMALFVAGCGADANPAPRGTVELARRHGETLAAAVARALTGSANSPAGSSGQPSGAANAPATISKPLAAPNKSLPASWTPLRGTLKSTWEVVPVAFAPAPGREQWQARLADRSVYNQRHARLMLGILDRDGKLPAEYPYPLEVWQFGPDLTFIAMAGEVVVDYDLRLKKELGADKLWVAGYSNDVFAYIPSRRVLEEGGYEGGGAMLYYGQPGPFAPSVEETIIRKVHELVERCRR